MPDAGQPGLELGVCGFYGQAVPSAKLVDLAVLDELVWPADANHRNAETKLVERDRKSVV